MKEKASKKNLKKNKKQKSEKSNKFVEILKKRWLINGTKTLFLIVIILAFFIGVTVLMKKLNLTPIDLTEDKLYTITEQSKKQVKDIDKDVNIYFIGYFSDSSNIDLAKQYTKANEKIKVENVNINDRPDLAEKYGIESDSTGIIVECGDKSKVLTESDLVTYDQTTYETINIAEQKFTNAILTVTSDKIPKVYFLEGYSNYSLNKNMYVLAIYLKNEVYEINTVNVLTTGKVPDDCDTLVITTPNKDFDEITTNAIIDYINSGKNILWLNGAKSQESDTPNINKILDMYGINPFDVGNIVETDEKKMAVNAPSVIIPDIENSSITKDFYYAQAVVLKNATRINVNEDKLDELKITKTDLIKTSDKAYFKTDYTQDTDEDTEKESILIGAEFDRTLKEANDETGEKAVQTKMIIIGENTFVSDYPILNNSQEPAIQIGSDNKDIVLNSISYLVDRPEDITARKTNGTVKYTATEQENKIILAIITAVPIIIIMVGIFVWIERKRKK